MNELIKVNYDNDRPTVMGRDLHEFLEVETRYNDWFKRMTEYGFTQNIDFYSILSKTPNGGRPSADHQLTIDMAKELCMIQRTEKGKQARQYFIQVEKAWNTPDMVMARALKMADTKLLSLQNAVSMLETENKLLTQKTLTWADRKVIEALVKKYGAKIGYQEAWREFKKELLYAHGINLNLRITNWRNEHSRKTGPKTLDMIHDEEIEACISTAVALCKNNEIAINDVIQKFSKEAV